MSPGRRQGDHSSLALLCAMIDPRQEQGLPWQPGDYRGLLEHLLVTELGREIPEPPAGSPGPARRPAAMPPGVTFAGMLADPTPSRDCLQAVKGYAKRAISSRSDALPVEAAKVLYIAVIAKARLCGQRSVSRLSDDEFANSARWCLAQGWAPGVLRDLVREALAHGRPRPPRDGPEVAR